MKTKKGFTALLEESLTEMLAVERGEMQPKHCCGSSRMRQMWS
jgi:hypothetical protein